MGERIVSEQGQLTPASSRNNATTGELAELQEVQRLQKTHDAMQVIKRDPALARADGSLLRWTAKTLINSHDREEAAKKWAALNTRQGRTVIDFSDVQRDALALPEEKVGELYEQVQNTLSVNAPYASAVVDNLVYGDHGHRWNDEYERRQKPKRSLELLRTHGVRISIAETDVNAVRQEYTEDASCPVLDRVKNKKIATVNGLPESKISLSIHDIFDHFWTYDQLEREGVLERYRDFLQSVGNPDKTDLFKREGELIASVSFEWRSSHTPERQFKPTFDLSFIKKIFGNAEINGMTDNQKRALDIVINLDPQGEEATRLGSMYNGILVELMEQRRKHGFIRKLDPDFQIIGNLPLLDPEYLALIVEINHFLCEPKTNATEALFHTETLVEDYLIRLAKGETKDDLVIRIADLETFDPTNSKVSPARQQWLRENTFHTATREDRCDDEDKTTTEHKPQDDEYLDLVDQDDQVTGRMLRSQVYKEGLSNFRVVNAFLRNSEGKLLFPKRQPTKKIAPNGLDFSIGEHVEAGESYDDAIRRGAREELNLDITQTGYRLIGKLTPHEHGTAAFMEVYEINTDEIPPYNPDDFSESSWLDPQEVRAMIRNGLPAKSDLSIVLDQLYPYASNQVVFPHKTE